jgi:predicted anti-sigma-YlaC factor YlaD
MGELSMSEHPEIRDLLGPQEEREVEEHLQGCAKCREEARDLRPVHERLVDLANATQTPPPELEYRVLMGMPHRETRRVGLVAAVAVLCVLAVLGVLYSTEFFGREAIASSVLQPTDLAPRAGRSGSTNRAPT